MTCHYCGAETREREIFCRNCGTRQRSAQEEIPAENVPLTIDEDEFEWKPNLDKLALRDLPALPDFLLETVSRNVLNEQKEEVSKFEPPRLQLPVSRGLGKMVFLGLLTLGIYPTVIWSRIVTELNLAASRYDGERTMPYFAMTLLAPVTLGIYMFVWFHDFSRRVGAELQRRGLGYRFGARDFWLWNVLGTLILAGPFVYTYKLMKAMNLINSDYNQKG